MKFATSTAAWLWQWESGRHTIETDRTPVWFASKRQI